MRLQTRSSTSTLLYISSIFFKIFLNRMYLLVGGETYIIVYIWRPETICRCRFSLPTMWVPEIEFRGSVLETSTITCYVISLALNLIVCVCTRVRMCKWMQEQVSREVRNIQFPEAGVTGSCYEQPKADARSQIQVLRKNIVHSSLPSQTLASLVLF